MPPPVSGTGVQQFRQPRAVLTPTEVARAFWADFRMLVELVGGERLAEGARQRPGEAGSERGGVAGGLGRRPPILLVGHIHGSSAVGP